MYCELPHYRKAIITTRDSEVDKEGSHIIRLFLGPFEAKYFQLQTMTKLVERASQVRCDLARLARLRMDKGLKR